MSSALRVLYRVTVTLVWMLPASAVWAQSVGPTTTLGNTTTRTATATGNTVSGNSTVPSTTISSPGNTTATGNIIISGNTTPSGNTTLSGNGTLSGNRTMTVPDPTGFAINPALKASMAAALSVWIKDGGIEFAPGLTYVAGTPVLMLMTDPNEIPSVQNRRHNAIVKACSFLLDDGAFDRVVVCVVEGNPGRGKSGSHTVRNTEVRRIPFQTALKGAGKSNNLSTALAAVKDHAAPVSRVCAELGIR